MEWVARYSQYYPVLEDELTFQESEVYTLSEKDKITTEEWKDLMDFPANDAVDKMLQSTTKMQVKPVESEHREISKQH